LTFPHLQVFLFSYTSTFIEDFLISWTNFVYGSFIALGASIRACKALYRHIIALEADTSLYQEVLVPLLPPLDEEEDSRPPSPIIKKRVASKHDDEPEAKKAPKRTCKLIGLIV
jgi:hypothetical protein